MTRIKNEKELISELSCNELDIMKKRVSDDNKELILDEKDKKECKF